MIQSATAWDFEEVDYQVDCRTAVRPVPQRTLLATKRQATSRERWQTHARFARSRAGQTVPGMHRRGERKVAC